MIQLIGVQVGLDDVRDGPQYIRVGQHCQVIGYSSPRNALIAREGQEKAVQLLNRNGHEFDTEEKSFVFITSTLG
jgi:hypothetical protein